MRNIFNNDRAPGFTMAERVNQKSKINTALVSIPIYAKLAGISSLKNIEYERLIVKFKDPSNKEHVSNFLNDFRAISPYYQSYDIFNAND